MFWMYLFYPFLSKPEYLDYADLATGKMQHIWVESGIGLVDILACINITTTYALATVNNSKYGLFGLASV